MRTSAWLVMVIGCLAFSSIAPAQVEPIGFEGAKWIWSAGGDAASPAAGSSYFRAEVDVPENPALKSAEVIVTCDNLFVLYVNGRPVGESQTGNNAWKNAKRWDVTGMIVPGRIVLAAEAINTLPGRGGADRQIRRRIGRRAEDRPGQRRELEVPGSGGGELAATRV